MILLEFRFCFRFTRDEGKGRVKEVAPSYTKCNLETVTFCWTRNSFYLHSCRLVEGGREKGFWTSFLKRKLFTSVEKLLINFTLEVDLFGEKGF